MHLSFVSILFLCCCLTQCRCALYPRDSETRESKSLDGLWTFVSEPFNSLGDGFNNEWFNKDLAKFDNATLLPVPCAFNDVTQSRRLRDHVGWVWYQTGVYVAASWFSDEQPPRVFLRFGSVNYYAVVFVNGLEVMNHTGGHLPFEVDVTERLQSNSLNIITVAANNTLSHSTIPPGEFVYETDRNRYPEGFVKVTPRFDFFNYAGILRSVVLYKIGANHVVDVTVRTDAKKGIVTAAVEKHFTNTTVRKHAVLRVTISDRDDVVVHTRKFTARTDEVSLTVPNHTLWYPIGMDPQPGYLYTMTLTLTLGDKVLDVYRLPFGIRSVRVTDKHLLINEKPFYCVGYGMHEDSDIRGRGFDRAVMVKDLNLLEWTGANCFRTSHYPYSEERMQEADRRGIAVFAETPGVGLNWFNEHNLQVHERMLRELVARDNNHPSVIAWSLANEPRNNQKVARDYFGHLVNVSHEVDSSRPVTIVSAVPSSEDQSADLVDFICVNRYYGWYIDTGYTEVIERSLTYDLTGWHKRFGKAIVLTEYGAGSIPGLNQDPSVDFSEEYQVKVLRETHKALDKLRTDFLTGEMVWNFADFATDQDVKRVNGNRKGVFTRNRQPKQAAYVIRSRYTNITQTN